MLLWSPGLTIQPSLRRLNKGLERLIHPIHHHLHTTLTHNHNSCPPSKLFTERVHHNSICHCCLQSCLLLILKEVKSTPLTSPSPHLLLYLILFFGLFFKFWCSSRSSPAKSCPLLPSHSSPPSTSPAGSQAPIFGGLGIDMGCL